MKPFEYGASSVCGATLACVYWLQNSAIELLCMPFFPRYFPILCNVYRAIFIARLCGTNICSSAMPHITIGIPLSETHILVVNNSLGCEKSMRGIRASISLCGACIFCFCLNCKILRFNVILWHSRAFFSYSPPYRFIGTGARQWQFIIISTFWFMPPTLYHARASPAKNRNLLGESWKLRDSGGKWKIYPNTSTDNLLYRIIGPKRTQKTFSAPQFHWGRGGGARRHQLYRKSLRSAELLTGMYYLWSWLFYHLLWIRMFGRCFVGAVICIDLECRRAHKKTNNNELCDRSMLAGTQNIW